jgi:diaminopimelate decarboxylase
MTSKRPTDQSILDAAQKHPTPFYIYDRKILRQSFADLRGALPSEFGIFYSMKANPHPGILSQLLDCGSGVDVGSKAELQMAIEAGFTPEKISFVGTGKTTADLCAAIEAEVLCLVVESLEELRMVETLGAQLNRMVSVCIRINPLSYTNYHGEIARQAPSQFGIDEEQLEEVHLINATQRQVRIVGLHFYISSQFFKSQNLLDNFAGFLAISAAFQERLQRPLGLVNLGGGFGLPYFAGQVEFDLAELKVGLQKLFSSWQRKFVMTKFYVESGRYIVGSCGAFITKILYRKQSCGRTYLVVDGGFAHHMSAVGIGQVSRKNFPLSVLSQNGNADETEIVTIAGPSCYFADILGEDVILPVTKVGDFICVGNSGAYGATFSPTDFLLPAEAGEFFC